MSKRFMSLKGFTAGVSSTRGTGSCEFHLLNIEKAKFKIGRTSTKRTVLARE